MIATFTKHEEEDTAMKKALPVFANSEIPSYRMNGWGCGRVVQVLVGVSLCLMVMLGVAVADTPHISDGDIHQALERRLVNDDQVAVHSIDVLVKDGIVTLTGTTNTLFEKGRIQTVAEMVKGVRSVVNRIQVEPSQPIKDDDLQQQVKNALFVDPATDSYEVDIHVEDGTVTLTGIVDSFAEKELAMDVARQVEGVKVVQNDISVQYTAPRSDDEIQEDIVQRLHFDALVDGDLVEVGVKDGRVTLSGWVGSARERNQAEYDAWVLGVKAVDSNDVKVAWWKRDQMQKDKYRPTSEEEIQSAVNKALSQDPRVAGFNPTVTVNNGIVVLRGKVDTLWAKEAAEQDAENTVGVRRVRNLLKVKPTDKKEDQEIAETIRAGLSRSPFVNRHDIRLSVLGGKAYLGGMVDTHYEKWYAEDIASRTKGVNRIANLIQVQTTWNWKSDAHLIEDIKDELWWSPYVNSEEVIVTVEDGIATLHGTVDTWQERRAATDNAFDAGARSVRNNLNVRYDGEWNMNLFS